MIAIEIKVDSALQDKINALRLKSESFNTLVSAAVRERALDVVAGAKELVPISTGALRRSIQATFYDQGFAAIIGSFLPYAARQEFDVTLNHHVRPARRRIFNTRSGRAGSIIKGTAQTNPSATWGFIRKSLGKVAPYFLADMQKIVDGFGEAWKS